MSYMQKSYDFGRELLKLIAIITMTFDHVGSVFFSNQIIWRIIGRFSFPIFCYLIILGLETTGNVIDYFKRLLIFAFISQIPYILALNFQECLFQQSRPHLRKQLYHITYQLLPYCALLKIL